MTIGQRGYIAIHDRASEKNITVQQECDDLDINSSIVGYWKRGESNPRADVLQKMAFAGYDVIYILTGEKT